MLLKILKKDKDKAKEEQKKASYKKITEMNE